MAEFESVEADDVDPEAVERLARLSQDLMDGIAAARPFLHDWPACVATRRVPRQHLPVLAHIDRLATAAAPETLPLVEAVVATAGTLRWQQTYAAADLGPAFLGRYGWTEFIGLRGPIPSTRLACGVLMLGPEADYPAHAHEAEELYLPLAGTALWQRGQDAYERKAPGLPIHHPSWLPHAMRTTAEPLLALYLWRGGDLAAKSRLTTPA